VLGRGDKVGNTGAGRKFDYPTIYASRYGRFRKWPSMEEMRRSGLVRRLKNMKPPVPDVHEESEDLAANSHSAKKFRTWYLLENGD
jgi:hypothetical protein